MLVSTTRFFNNKKSDNQISFISFLACNQTATEQINKMFSDKNLMHSFRSLKYLGFQTKYPPTDYKKLRDLIHHELENLNHSSRPLQLKTPKQIYDNFHKLNIRFSNDVTTVLPPFSVRILECSMQCEICRASCRRSMNHEERHANSECCVFDQKFENKRKLCKKCYNNIDDEVPVTEHEDTASSYAITSYISSFMPFTRNIIINCPNCGDIYKSSTTKQPEENFVHTKDVHVWPGQDAIPKGPIHSGQKVIDSITWIRDTVSTYTSVPVKCTKNCINNITKPEYWRSDEEIHKCHNCSMNFEKLNLSKHHCRNCGEVFCNACSKKRIPVPHRGWIEPSRVCDDCHRNLSKGIEDGESFGFLKKKLLQIQFATVYCNF